MAFRRKTSIRRGGTRKRGMWINIPFGAVAFTESVGNQLLLTPEDWEAQFAGNGIESATLRTIQGQITIQQTVVGTLGTTGFWGIYMADKDATVVPTFTVANMGDNVWLTTGAFGTQGTLSSINNVVLSHRPVSVKAKRKLTSRDALYICAQYGADAAAPAGVLGGLLRFFVARD